jgi:hypothetical protein
MSTTPRTEAQRFDPVNHCEQGGSSYGQMKRSPDGDYVPVELAFNLECENARLRETLEAALQASELDYKSAVQDYEEAQEQCVSCFQEHNAASYQKGIRDGLRNLLATIHVAMEAGK